MKIKVLTRKILTPHRRRDQILRCLLHGFRGYGIYPHEIGISAWREVQTHSVAASCKKHGIITRTSLIKKKLTVNVTITI